MQEWCEGASSVMCHKQAGTVCEVGSCFTDDQFQVFCKEPLNTSGVGSLQGDGSLQTYIVVLHDNITVNEAQDQMNNRGGESGWPSGLCSAVLKALVMQWTLTISVLFIIVYHMLITFYLACG